MLMPCTEASMLERGSWRLMIPLSMLFVPQVRSLVVDRSSSSLFVLVSVSAAVLSLVGLFLNSVIPFLCDLRLRAFQLCCDDFQEFFVHSVAALAPSVSFALVTSLFMQGSSIGSKSRK